LNSRKIDDLSVHAIFGSVFQALSGPARVRFPVMPGCQKQPGMNFNHCMIFLFIVRGDYFRLK